MTISKQDLQAIATLVGQELEPRFQGLEESMDRRFDEVLQHIDGLAKQNERQDQEALVFAHQLERLEKRVEVLETAVG